MIKDLIKKNRSYRRFDNSHIIFRSELEELLELARFSSCASNKQLLRFFLSTQNDTNQNIFSCLKWAGYLHDWNGPLPHEQPSAYIVILKPLSAHAYIAHDTGIAAQSLLLGAVEKGLGGCIFGAVDRTRLHNLLHLPAQYQIEIVIALGKPVEIIQIDDALATQDIKYFRKNHIHHVPKLLTKELIIK